MSEIQNNQQIKKILNDYINYLKENPIKHCISALDFSSLYPSLIMAYNLSPEYLILNEDYKNKIENKGYKIHNIKFEYKYENYLKEKKIEEIKAWTVRHNEEKKENTMFGLYPNILKNLFSQRAEMKKSLVIYEDKKEHIEKYEKDYLNNEEYKECLFKLKYCDTKQKALKVFMNTFYGEMGNKNSPLFQLPLAGGVTSAGRHNLLLVKKYVESLEHEVYYGDSVTGNTPIIIRNNNIIRIVQIKDLGWNTFKTYICSKSKKEYILMFLHPLTNIEVYTENGWTKIRKMIRHKTNKRLYRIYTKTSIVEVTEDHSLLKKNKEKIKPKECKIGTQLLSWDNIKLEDYTEYTEYSLEYYISQKYIYCYTQEKAQIIYLHLIKRNYNVLISTFYYNNNKNPIYKLTITKDEIDLENEDKIIKIEYIGHSIEYVYDLETKSHHFAAGIGKLVVHNTDSLYMECPKKYYIELDKKYYTNEINKIEYNTELVLKTFEAIKDINKKVNQYLYEDNGTRYLKMGYEEVLYPLAFLSKKKYFGIPHKTMANFKPKDLFIRGLEVKKRGVSELLKIICLDLMWKSMDLNNTKTLRELVILKIKEIFSKKWNKEDFIQTGVWRPEKKNITLNNFAERMREENKQLPIPGERFNYVIIKRYPYKYDYKGRQIELTKADKMEYLDIVEKYNYEIDLKYYFDKQLTGQFARLISYDEEFEHKILDELTQSLEVDDEKTMRNCKKYILTLVNNYTNTFIDRKHIFKNLYKNVNIKYQEKKEKIYTNKYNILFNSKCMTENELNKLNEKKEENIYKIILDNINYYLIINNDYENIIYDFIKKNKNKNKKQLIHTYNNNNNSYYNKHQRYLHDKFTKELNKLLNLLSQYNLQDKIFNIDNLNVINIINYIRKQKDLDNICNSNIKDIELESIINESDILEKMNEESLYININKEILKEIYELYISLIIIKKNKLIQEGIYNKLYKDIFSNSEYKQKPSKIDRLNFD